MPDQDIRLLALDGGGVRGLSSLIILKKLMETIGQDPPPKPCDYFDMIGGTSTGGLIAIMLGRLKMSIDECIHAYLSLSERIFQKRHRIKTNGKIQGRFDSTELERAIKEVITKQGLDENALLQAETNDACKVFVCATSKETKAIECLKSYKSPRGLSDLKIWEACRATSAASSFFDPIAIGLYEEEFVDGATGANNPVWQVWDQAQLTWGSDSIEGRIKCLVSIGTGIPSLRPFKDDVFHIGQTLLDIATGTEQTAEAFRRDKTYLDNTSRYYRFNVTHGLEDIGLEESKKKKEIAAATRRYLESQDVLKQMHACVNNMACGQDSVYNYTADELDCLRSLWPTGIDYESQKNQNPKRVPNTCLWTLKNPKYINWRDDSTKKLLWISADPGCGKSVLARCIVDEDLPQDDPPRRILYYFFKDTSPEQRSASRAISAVLYQLFVSQPRLIRHALPSYHQIGKALSATFPKLWSVFTTASADPIAGDVFCVLDALDECNEQEQETLIKALENFYLYQPTSSSRSRLKILVTSRPYFEIRRNFDELLNTSINIELAGNDESADIKKEIDSVIKHRVSDLARKNRLQPKVADHLEKRLLETEHRTYLWLRLLWEIIKDTLSTTITKINQLIDKLPAGIQDAYENLLQRCPEPSFARKVLQIVLVAGRPLTVEEMDVALKVNEDTSSYDDLELEEPSALEEMLPTRCGLMISIVQSKVYFIHQTVKEFLLQTVGVEPPVGRTWQNSLCLEESHDVMAEICLQFIDFSEIRLDRVNLCNALVPDNIRHMDLDKDCQSYVFLSYAAVYWAEHYRKTPNSKYMRTIARFLEAGDRHPIIDRDSDDVGSTLTAASLGGHDKVVRLLLDKGADVNAYGGYFGTALQTASARGHYKIVQLLLDKGADVNAQGGIYNNALQAASALGHYKVVQLLLDKGANVNAQGGHYGNALQAALQGGYSSIVQLLLDNGAKVRSKNRKALRNWYKWLVKQGISIDPSLLFSED
ncbi:MAG: hypothetical protein Q9209_007471 [Squamulea sp. 1 TL-2023]